MKSLNVDKCVCVRELDLEIDKSKVLPKNIDRKRREEREKCIDVLIN